MYGHTQELARQRQARLMREAEQYRLTRQTRATHSAERRASMRRIVMTAVGLALWPFKH